MPNTTVLAPGVYETEEVIKLPTAPAKVAAKVADRRRPGRAEINPALVPLLRKPTTPETEGADTEELWADRAPARGLIVGVMISAVLWIIGLGALALAFL